MEPLNTQVGLASIANWSRLFLVTIQTIDLQFQSVPSLIAAFLVEEGDERILIECGPASTNDTLVSELAVRGVAPTDISDVFLTHIHFDHAGACGWWAKQGARIHVHPQGARHLLDPRRLNESARMIYKDKMDTLWGEFIPVPEDQLNVLEDLETVMIGDIELTAWDTPGHARHHHAYSIGDSLFTGDVAGMRMPDCSFISITGAPPQFDPIAYQQSIQRLKAESFSALYLTHFGKFTDVEAHWSTYAERLANASEEMEQQASKEPNEIREFFYKMSLKNATDEGLSPEKWEAYEKANPSDLSADGIALYWKKQQKDKASS